MEDLKGLLINMTEEIFRNMRLLANENTELRKRIEKLEKNNKGGILLDFNNREDVLKATFSLIKDEDTDVFSYYIKNDDVREYVVTVLKDEGYNVINRISNRHIYVDLKSV